jgi:predicted GNAT superfamily acetyltransferase
LWLLGQILILGMRFKLEVGITSPAFIWFQQEKNHYFLYDHVLMVKKGDKVILTQRRFAKQKGGTDSLGIITVE